MTRAMVSRVIALLFEVESALRRDGLSPLEKAKALGIVVGLRTCLEAL